METLRAMRFLHAATGRGRWLDAAMRAAHVALTWFFLADVPFDPRSHAAQAKLRTTGLSLVSTENNHADVYLFSFPSDLYWLYTHTGDQRLRQMAVVCLAAALQLVPTSVNRLGPFEDGSRSHSIPEGGVPEVLNHSWWVYFNKPVMTRHRNWTKGYFNERSSYWTLACVWNAINGMMDIAGRDPLLLEIIEK